MKGVLIGAIALVVAAAATPVRATPVAADGFESYTAGAALNGGSAGNGGTGANGEFGWTNNWTSVSGVNVQAATLATGSGARTAESDDTTDNIVAMTRSFTPQTATVYFSVLYNAAAGLDGSDFIHVYLGNSNTTNNNSGGIGDIDTASTAFGARIGTTNGGTTINSTTTGVQGTTYLLVGKLSKISASNYNRVELFVNPAGLTEPGTASATQNGDAGISQVSVFSVRTFNLDAGDKYQIDSVRIGTAFADVVPEPGSLGILAVIGCVGMLARRRARRPKLIARS